MLITEIYTPDKVALAAKELQLGELVAFPTETVYGLGADATNAQAVKRVYLAKGRPSDNPLIVTVCSKEMVKRYIGDLPETAQKLMDAFWPGSLTIILPIKAGLLPDAVTGGLKTAAFRMPANQITLELIKEAGVPLVGPSANSSGKPSPTTAEHVFHDLEGKIKGIVDDGPTTVGVESTIVDLSTAMPTVLRPGAVTSEQISEILGCEVRSDKHHVGQAETPKAPGMKYKHYAPDAQVLIVNADEWEEALAWAKTQTAKIGVMAFRPEIAKVSELPENIEGYSLGSDVKSASSRLFSGLRTFDSKDYILCAGVLETGLGEAYMNRLKKAAGNAFFKEFNKNK